MQTIFNSGLADASTCLCSRCGNRLPTDDINVVADTALCRRCGAAHRYSDLIHGLLFDLANPPQGASYEAVSGGFVARASTRSAEALFLFPFLLVFAGISLGGIFGRQFEHGHFNLGQWLFPIPFIMAILSMAVNAIMSACGHVTVARNGDDGLIFQGVGRIGWTQRFCWPDLISAVEVYSSLRSRRGRSYPLIRLVFVRDGRSALSFGTLLPEEQRWFLLSVIRSQLG
jgi:hypothetical protein